jgi:hypothetical protein
MRWIPREKAGELPIRVPRSDSPDSRNSGARDVSCIEWHVPDGKDSYLKTMARRLHRSRHRMHRLFTQVPTQCRDVPWWRGSMGSYHFAIEFRGAVGRSMSQDFATTMSCHRLENSSFIESSHLVLGGALVTALAIPTSSVSNSADGFSGCPRPRVVGEPDSPRSRFTSCSLMLPLPQPDLEIQRVQRTTIHFRLRCECLRARPTALRVFRIAGTPHS